jgi:hypothetical protein
MSTVTQFVCKNGIGINGSFGNSCESQEWVLEFINEKAEELEKKFLHQHSGFLKNRAFIGKEDIINAICLYVIENQDSINQFNVVEKINQLKLKDLNLTYDSRELFFDMNSDQDSLNESLNLVSHDNPEYILINKEEINEENGIDIKNINYDNLSKSIVKIQTKKKQKTKKDKVKTDDLETDNYLFDEYEEQAIIKLFKKMTNLQRMYWSLWFEYRNQTTKTNQAEFTKFANEKSGITRTRQSIFCALRRGVERAGIINKKLSKEELERIQNRIPMQEFIVNIKVSAKYPIYVPNVNKESKRTAKVLVFSDCILSKDSKNNSIEQQKQISCKKKNSNTKAISKSAKIFNFTAATGKSKISLDKITSQTPNSHNSYPSIASKDNLLNFPNIKIATKQTCNGNGSGQKGQSQQRNQILEISNALFIRSRISQLEPVFRDGFA